MTKSAPGRLAWITGLVVLAVLVWITALIVVTSLREKQIQVAGNDAASIIAAARQETVHFPGNLAFVVLESGRVAGEQFMSIGRPVDGDTLFQMASVSKWVTAWGVLALVESGRIDLDAPVSRYLRRWDLPPSEYDNDQVTVRRLLSHTAGLTDGLGYCGFAPGRPFQSLQASLTEAADACPFTDGRAAVGAPPGEWQYSGGGYSLLQLLIEDVSGQSFADYMDTAVLGPLGMIRSTFRPRAAGATNIAEFFAADGSPAQHFGYTAAAAASLYSSTADLTKFVNAHQPGPNGAAPGRGVISPASVALLQKAQVPIAGRPHWGLGVRLYASARSGGYVFGHDGGNLPAVNTAIRLDPVSGDAMIALSTGGDVIASRLAAAWLRQRVNSGDLPDGGFSPFAILAKLWSVRLWLASGTAVICLCGVVAAIQSVRARSAARR